MIFAFMMLIGFQDNMVEIKLEMIDSIKMEVEQLKRQLET